MNPHLFIGIPIYGSVPWHFMASVMKLMESPPCSMQIKPLVGDSLVSRARNTIAADFLTTDCTHLLFIDSDLIFSPEQITRLLSHNEDIVAGFYPKKQEGELQWVCNAKIEETQKDSRGLQEVRYMGTGFLLIKRGVFERMIGRYGEEISYHPDSDPTKTEWDFWSVGVHQPSKRYLSEDWLFCQRALDLGYKVWGDTKVVVKHVGQAVFPLQSQEPGIKTESEIPKWLQDEVEQYFVPLSFVPETILDIGANIGAFAVRAHELWPKAEISCFEPMRSNVEELHKNAPFATIHAAAIRAESGPKDLFLGDMHVTGSFIKGDRQTGNKLPVICFAASGLVSRELVKIDTEGCEVEILKNLDLSATKAIFLEHHSREDAATIKEFLSEDFRMVGEDNGKPVGTMQFIRHEVAPANASARSFFEMHPSGRLIAKESVVTED